MAEQMMDPELAAEIVAGIEARVGTHGDKSVITNEPRDRYNAVGLSRGGVILPRLSEEEHRQARRAEHVYQHGEKEGQLRYPDAPAMSTPHYEQSLAAVWNHLGTDDDQGRGGRSPEGHVTLDSADSSHYVFRQGADGLWRAYDVWDASSGNYWTDNTTYFVDAARMVTSDEEGLTIQGLFTVFDEGLARQAQSAVDWEARPEVQSRF